MLESIHIENIAVIEAADIDFTTRFNVLTGETGAGKSIIIDSINAVLGSRTSHEIVRTGCETATVVAVFSDLNKTAAGVINEFGYSLDDDKKVVLQRIISSGGKNSFKINGVSASSATVREIGKYLITIHGQHDNQALLDAKQHCAFIDNIANNDDIKAEYYTEFKKFNEIRKELSAIETDDSAKARTIDLLNHQISEIESANVKLGEYSELKQKQKSAEEFEKNANHIAASLEKLNGNAETDGAVSLLNAAAKNIAGVNIPEISEILPKLNDVLSNLTDIGADLHAVYDANSFDEGELNSISDRLDLLNSLMLKYGGSEEKVVSFLNDAKAQLNNIVFADERAEQLYEQLSVSEKCLVDLAKKLTDSRKKAAAGFEKAVCGVLCELDMPNVKFAVDFKQGHYTKNGCDEVEFLLSTNVGEELRPLAKTASGGELSRVMLSIKSVLSEGEESTALIFDEIDTGISGRAASKVAVQLNCVANTHQVICVTHLAQIAAKANNHLLIQKSALNGRTYTTVQTLNTEQRIEEIARIMSGTEITDNLYNSAKELLNRS